MIDMTAGPGPTLRVAALGLLIVAGLVALVAALGHDWEAALRDPNASPPGTPWAGSISSVGVAMVTVALVAMALRTVRRWTLGAAWMTFFCAVFLVDDYFTIHENLPAPEVLLFAVIGMVYAMAWLRYADAAGTWRVWPILVVFALFATSIFFDVVYARVAVATGLSEAVGNLLEDCAKFAGIFTLMSFALGEARAARR
jgi:hypothetical protein